MLAVLFDKLRTMHQFGFSFQCAGSEGHSDGKIIN